MPSLYPIFDEDMPIAEGFDGASVSTHLEELDHIAASLSLLSLASFIDARTMALQVLDEDRLPANCPPVCWYSAKDGLVTVQGLLFYLKEHPEQLADMQAAVTAELRKLAALLEDVAKSSNRFHLLVDL